MPATSTARAVKVMRKTVSPGCCDVDRGVSVVDEVELPHPADLVLDEVDEIRADQVEEQHSEDDVEPQRQVDEVEEAEAVGGGDVAGLDHQQAEEQPDGDHQDREQQVEHRVARLVVAQVEARQRAFEDPEEHQTDHQDAGARPVGHALEEIDQDFHQVSPLVAAMAAAMAPTILVPRGPSAPGPWAGRVS
jgi:hypothetical protein